MSAGLAGEAAAGLALEGPGGGGGAAGVTQITSIDGSVAIANPTGPITDLSVPGQPPFVGELLGEQTPGGAGPTFDFDNFWPADIDVGKFWYGALVQPRSAAGTTYFLSDGPQGAHAALLGFNPQSPGLIPAGNLNTTGGLMSYTAQLCDVIGVNEWARVDVGMDANFLYIWINGMLSKIQGNLGIRHTYPTETRHLYVGHYSHQTFLGRVAWLNLFDVNVFAQVQDPTYAYRVSTLPEVRRLDANGLIVYPDATPDFTKGGPLIANNGVNQSQPLTGTRYRLGPPRLGTPIFSSPFAEFANENPETLVPGLVNSLRPTIVRDPTCPAFTTAPRTSPNGIVSAPVAPPVDGRTSLLFTNFPNRISQFLLTDNPSLGPCALGTVGPQNFTTRAYDTVNNLFKGWGVAFGSAVSLAYSATGEFNCPAYVNPGNAAAGIEITWPSTAFISGFGAAFPGGPGIVWRLADIDNFWYAAVRFNNSLEVGTYTAGVRATIATIACPVGTNGLRMLPTGNSFQFYSSGDGGASWVAQGPPVVNAYLSTQTRAGIVAGGSAARISTFRASI